MRGPEPKIALTGVFLAVTVFPALARSSRRILWQTRQSAFTRNLDLLGIAPQDLDEIPSRWPTLMTTPEVERLLEDPLEIPDRSQHWETALQNDAGVFSALQTAQEVLGVPTEPVPMQVRASLPQGCILQARRAGISTRAIKSVGRIYGAIASSQLLLNRAVGSLPEPMRARALDFFKGVLIGGIGAHPDISSYQAASGFNRAALFAAAQGLAQSIEAETPVLEQEAQRTRGFPIMRWGLPEGLLILSGASATDYGPQDLSRAALIVNFGDNGVYQGPAAAAGPGEIRVVIDLGKNIVVESSEPAAGSGVLGIGMMFLPVAGHKTIHAGDFSAGAGLFGVGAFDVSGDSITIKSGSFSQGAGAFGAGLFISSGARADLSADFAAEGFGFSYGAGFFKMRGNGASLSCGFAKPDGHEDKAFLSLCQGAGYGPRAFAAGGVGLAALETNGSRVESSYNSQGSGYWHGLGVLAVFGDGNHFLARRYGQGSGIHMAAGSLLIKGSGNAVENWGVGPGFGWDRGIGSLSVVGDSNTLYSQWDSASALVNGEALAQISGQRNVIALHDFGLSFPARDGPSYVLAAISGNENILEEPWAEQRLTGFHELRFGPWSSVVSSGTLNVGHGPAWPSPQWPKSAELRQQAAVQERIALEKIINGDGKTSPDVLGNCLLALASVNLDGSMAARAMAALLSLPAAETKRLPELLSPENFDELLWVNLIAASQGERLLSNDLLAIKAASGLRKALLLGLLGFAPSGAAQTAAMNALNDPDWRVRAQAESILGSWQSQVQGEDMGRLRFLDLAQGIALSSGAFDALNFDELNRRAIGDFFSILSLDPEFSANNKAALAFKAANPFDSAGVAATSEFARQLRARKAEYVSLFHRQIHWARSQTGLVRQELIRGLEDPNPNVQSAAITALGGIGHAPDASRIARFLTARSAHVRISAAFALSKMGPAGSVEISHLLKSRDPVLRKGAALAAAHDWDPGVFILLRNAMMDRDWRVRLEAVADISIATQPVLSTRKQFIHELTKLKDGDPSPDVRWAAARAIAEIGG